jgi:hypothetical protein
MSPATTRPRPATPPEPGTAPRRRRDESPYGQSPAAFSLTGHDGLPSENTTR